MGLGGYKICAAVPILLTLEVAEVVVVKLVETVVGFCDHVSIFKPGLA